MDQSFHNENRVSVNETCGVFINDVKMEKTCDENPNVQTEINRNPKGENEQLMQNIIKSLCVYKKVQKPMEELHYVSLLLC